MKSFLLVVGLFSSLLNIGESGKVPFTDCSADGYETINIELSPCVGHPCQIARCSNVTMTATFSLDASAKALCDPKANVTVNDTVPYYPAPVPICSYLTCPVQPGVTAILQVVFCVRCDLPTGLTTVKIEILQGCSTTKVTVCFSFQVTVT